MSTIGRRADELPLQISALSADRGGALDSGALYALWAGGNDMLQGQSAASTVTDLINAVLGLSASPAGLSGVTVDEYDVASLINGIFADPVGSGFSAGLALCTEDLDCNDGIGTEDFVMMDHVHPMSGPGDLIAAGALAAVPEPSTALGVSLGLAILGVRRRRARGA